MTFASRMQHKIYWGPMKKPIEWSLKTVLAPWAYIASVIYHDSFWYPVQREARDAATCSTSPWGRLFRNWETVQRRTPNGYPDVGDDARADREDRRQGAASSRSASSARASRKRRSSPAAAGTKKRDARRRSSKARATAKPTSK